MHVKRVKISLGVICGMSELKHKINSVMNSNADPDTKSIYQNQLSLFYRYSDVIKNLEFLIGCSSDVLQKELEGYCNFLNSRVSNGGSFS